MTNKTIDKFFTDFPELVSDTREEAQTESSDVAAILSGFSVGEKDTHAALWQYNGSQVTL